MLTYSYLYACMSTVYGACPYMYLARKLACHWDIRLATSAWYIKIIRSVLNFLLPLFCSGYRWVWATRAPSRTRSARRDAMSAWWPVLLLQVSLEPRVLARLAASGKSWSSCGGLLGCFRSVLNPVWWPALLLQVSLDPRVVACLAASGQSWTPFGGPLSCFRSVLILVWWPA